MTEDEAKTKWCPMVKLTITPVRLEDTRCIGSDCMMWREKITNQEYDVTDDGDLLVHTEKEGYCGLAGNPNV